MENIYCRGLITLSLSALLVSCGGGDSSSNVSTTNVSTTPTTTDVNPQSNIPKDNAPQQINASNWRLSRALNRNVAVTTTSYSQGNHTWTVTINDDSVSDDDHLQVYLDTDNNPATGYQFDNQAWANKSGADYLIEDDVLFESTANDDTWSWKYIVPLEITRNGSQIQVSVPVSRFKGLCNTYSIGTIGMTSDWDIETFYPLSNDMAVKSIAYCDDLITNHQPVITLNDTTPIIIELNANFEIPPATAFDEEDGDISSSIQSSSNVNTAQAGTYGITYTVGDSEGLAAIPVTRSVTVQEASSSFIIDGNTNDWINITALSQFNGNTLKVTDDAANLYILVEATNLGENTQILINSDNNASTGTAIHGTGIDFMVENALISKYIGTTINQWAWDYGFINIPFVKNQNVLEISIPKSALGDLTNTINIGFKSLNDDWIIGYSIPELLDTSTYNLAFAPSEEQVVIAAADSATTNNTTAITIDVLSNDTERLGRSLEVTQVSAPSSGGTAVIAGNKINYTPSSTFNGTDTFTYNISDGQGNGASATVTVNVTTTNTAPSAFDDTASTDNVSSVIVNVLVNDTDPENDTLSISSVSSPANGTAVVQNNAILYTPNSQFTGTDTFTYTITDTELTTTATVSITVISINRPPVAGEDAPQTEFNTPIEIDVLANDTDPDGDTLTILNFTQPTLGVVTQVNDSTLLFDPQGNIASISFTYTVSDGRGGTDIATVTVASNDPNDEDHADFPVISDENITINVGETILIDVLANDFDPDGDTLHLDQVDDPEHGTTVKINGKVQYTPDSGFVGTDEFYYGVHDGFGHNGAGKVTITVR